MAFTTYVTVAFGDPWSAANNNTYNRDNINQLWAYTTTGDLAYASGATTLSRLAIGTVGQVLTVNAGATAPEWSAAKGTDYILLVDEQASGVDGGAFTSGAWRTRVLNTEKADTGNHAALASNQITLLAGTYRITATAPAVLVSDHILRLQNITDAATILTGTSAFASGMDGEVSQSFIFGRFTIGDTKVIELQHRCTATRAADGFGSAASFQAETYAVVELLREAD